MDFIPNNYIERPATLIYDCHTINASTGDMTETEVKYFCNLVRKYIRDKFNIDSEYRVNTITYGDPENPGQRKLKGVSYIYWKAPEAYHIILGNRPDGTSLTRQIEVDSDDEPSQREISSWDDITSKPASSWDDIMDHANDDGVSKSWADMSENTEKSKKIITVKDEPLIPDFVYTRNNGTKISITMQALFIRSFEDDRSNNYDMYKLSGLVPKSMTVDQLLKMFEIFSNRPGYPKIEIKQNSKIDTFSKNIAFVTFCPGTNDARFAREIMLFSKVKLGNKEEILKFDHPLTKNESADKKSFDRGDKKKLDKYNSENRNKSGFGKRY